MVDHLAPRSRDGRHHQAGLAAALSVLSFRRIFTSCTANQKATPGVAVVAIALAASQKSLLPDPSVSLTLWSPRMRGWSVGTETLDIAPTWSPRMRGWSP